MADYTFGVVKQAAANISSAEETLTIGLDFWTLTTGVNILISSQTNGTATSQAALNKLIEIISLNGQPVILNNPSVSNGTYTLTFAIEHPGSWVAGTYLAGAVAPTYGPQTLINAIQVDGVNFGFSTDTVLSATLTSELQNNS